MKLKQTIVAGIAFSIVLALAVNIFNIGFFLWWRGPLRATCERVSREIIDYRESYGILPDRLEDLDAEMVNTLPDEIVFKYYSYQQEGAVSLRPERYLARGLTPFLGYQFTKPQNNQWQEDPGWSGSVEWLLPSSPIVESQNNKVVARKDIEDEYQKILARYSPESEDHIPTIEYYERRRKMMLEAIPE